MMSTMTTANWARLGAALVAAREELGLQQQEVAQRIGVKRGALANIEHGRIAKVTTTLRAYARLVGWTDDSLEVVLAGGEPIARQDAHQESTPFGASPEEPSDLSLASVSNCCINDFMRSVSDESASIASSITSGFRCPQRFKRWT